jgi:hypothetical protein
MIDNPMTLRQWTYRPRYHEVIDEDLNERYVVDEHGREIDPALLCEEEETFARAVRNRREENPAVDSYEEMQIERYGRINNEGS